MVWFLLILISQLLQVEGERRSLIPQPISSASPEFYHVNSYALPKPDSYYWKSNIKGPIPTNSWFTNAAMGTDPISPYPYQIRSYDYGFIACYPKIGSLEDVAPAYWRDDIIIQLPGVAKRQIIDFDTLSFTQQWTGSGGTLTVKHIPGSPYITMNFTGPRNYETNATLELEIRDPTNPDAIQLWMLYSLTGEMMFFVEENKILIRVNSGNPFNVLRLAAVPRSTSENKYILYHYKKSIPSTGIVDVQFPSQDESHIYYQFNPIDAFGNPTNNLLMLGLTHHLQTVENSSVQFILPRQFRTVKGPMTGLVGNQWILKEKLTDTTWFSKTPVDEKKINAIRYVLKQDINGKFQHKDNDTYPMGKWVAGLARLALIAEEVDSPDLLELAVRKLDKELTPWVTRVYYRNTFLYDQTFGGIISADGWLDGGADFSNSMYNDHHFHYGYYIYAAAVLLKYRPDWPWANRITDLIRDIANPSEGDPFFPITRNKDWFVGHSWAAGLFQAGDGKNQESTSEAINAYYGIYLFGLVTNNQLLTNLGRVMLSTEIRSTIVYWHIDQFNDEIYSDPFTKNSIVGVLWEGKAHYATWFGDKVEYIHCIQMLPFTPITAEYLTPIDWVKFEYSILSVALSDKNLTNEWRAYIYEDWAIIDREAAWGRAVQTLKDDAFRGGNSRSNVYWWIASRPLIE